MGIDGFCRWIRGLQICACGDLALAAVENEVVASPAAGKDPIFRVPSMRLFYIRLRGAALPVAKLPLRSVRPRPSHDHA
jgi:hypothetical protein